MSDQWFPEDPDDFHRWVKPTPAPCPDCPCCSARLCETGNCLLMAGAADKDAVKGCPCDKTRLAIEAARQRKLAERSDGQTGDTQ